MKSRICLIIPAYKPEKILLQLVQELQSLEHWKAVCKRIVVVDDGSGEEYQEFFTSLSKFENVTVLRHGVNLGKGQALKTAFNAVLVEPHGVCGVVTADADGQHSSADILQIAEEILAHPGVVLGVRNFGREIPFRSKIGNRFTRLLFRFVTGAKVSDTQTGLRGIALDLLPKLMRLKSTGYDFETDALVRLVHQGIKIQEIPIETIYIDENRSSHFNVVRDSMAISYVLIRYGFSSISTSVLDFLAFGLMFMLKSDLLVSMVIGRTVAVGFNFFVAKKLVFRRSEHGFLQAAKFLGLVIFMLFITVQLIEVLVSWTKMSPILAKIIVESVLFFVNFSVQRTLIFGEE